MQAELQTLKESDTLITNVLHASGPGTGLGKLFTVAQDDASVEQYGAYVRAVSFDAAVNIADLEAKARAYLDEHRTPLETLALKVVIQPDDPGIEMGDRVPYAAEGIYISERVMGIEWQPGGAVLHMKTPFHSPVDGLLDPDEAENREKRALGLPPPVGFVVETAQPGLRLKFNPFVDSRAQGVEIHVALREEDLYNLNEETFIKRTSETEVHLSKAGNLLLNQRWFVCIRAYAGSEVGEESRILSALAGFITDVIDPSIEERLDQIAADERFESIAAEVEGIATEVRDTRIILGTVSGVFEDVFRDDVKDFVALEVRPGWELRFPSGPLARRVYTVTEVAPPDKGEQADKKRYLVIDPPFPAAINLVNVPYELSNGRGTTIGTSDIVINLSGDGTASGFSAVSQTANQLLNTVADLDGSAALSQFTSIRQLSDDITLLNADVNGNYAQIALLNGEIDLRVSKDNVVASLNLDPTGVRISGQKIQLNGSVAVTGNIDITKSGQTAYRLQTRASDDSVQTAIGNLQGLAWGSGVLPNPTFGVWARKGYFKEYLLNQGVKFQTYESSFPAVGREINLDVWSQYYSLSTKNYAIPAGRQLHFTHSLTSIFSPPAQAVMRGYTVEYSYLRSGLWYNVGFGNVIAGGITINGVRARAMMKMNSSNEPIPAGAIGSITLTTVVFELDVGGGEVL